METEGRKITVRGDLSKEDSVIIVSIAMLFILLILFTILLLNGENRRNRILIEYQAEKTVNSYIEVYRENQDLSVLKNDRQIIGFGLYYASGDAYKLYGDAPQKLSGLYDTTTPSSYFKFVSREHVLIMIRPLGMQRGMMMGNRGLMSRMYRNAEGLPHFAYIKLDISDFFKKQRIYSGLLVSLPIILIILMGSFVFLYRSNVTYRKKMAAQSQLVTLGEAARTLAHEIKNPLGAIRIQTGYLKRVLPEERKAELAVIDEEIERISSLTDKIGDFLRNPKGDPEIINLDNFIKELLMRFKENIDYKNNSTGDILILFDRERLRSVLENLIRNALESGEDMITTGKSPVEIELDKKRTHVYIYIRDRGKGIPEKLINRVYDPFYTTKTKGSGIGLSLSKRFIEAMNGSIKIKHREHGGTEILITLSET
ncbi:MAG: HAMP domain-containing histidine kinase [Spirochaetes bacterium]|nr:HAMP domain-containing histidine kinase [Spirochaetota bacterium]